MSMKSVDILSNIIKQYGENWREKVLSYLKGELSDEDPEMIIEFLNQYKEDIIENNKESISKIYKIIDDGTTKESLDKYMNDMLEGYYNTSALRYLEKQDIAKAKNAVDFIFEQMVLRYNPEASECYAHYGFENKQSLLNVADVMQTIAVFCVVKNFYVSAICKVVYENTRLSEKLCNYIAEIVDRNFYSIQSRLLFEQIGESKE